MRPDCLQCHLMRVQFIFSAGSMRFTGILALSLFIICSPLGALNAKELSDLQRCMLEAMETAADDQTIGEIRQECVAKIKGAPTGADVAEHDASAEKQKGGPSITGWPRTKSIPWPPIHSCPTSPTISWRLRIIQAVSIPNLSSSSSTIRNSRCRTWKPSSS